MVADNKDMLVCGMILSPKSYCGYVLQCVKCGEAKFDKLTLLFEHLHEKHPNYTSLTESNGMLPAKLKEELKHAGEEELQLEEVDANDLAEFLDEKDVDCSNVNENGFDDDADDYSSLALDSSKIEIVLMKEENSQEYGDEDYAAAVAEAKIENFCDEDSCDDIMTKESYTCDDDEDDADYDVDPMLDESSWEDEEALASLVKPKRIGRTRKSTKLDVS